MPEIMVSGKENGKGIFTKCTECSLKQEEKCALFLVENGKYVIINRQIKNTKEEEACILCYHNT